MIGTQVANYRIEEKLGEGGMGVVYKAVDVNLDRTVAIKFLSSELNRDPGLIERFQSEAKAQANLNHTNIATLYNFINVDGNWLIAMEYVDGINLEETILRNGVMQHHDAVPLFKQALLGIGFAHRFGIIHRDIKPANIMINRHGIVKVMDFGIAKVLSGRRLTRTGVAVGTVAYMSPEQIKNQGIDIRSDIYSLGVTLYQMLTGHVPFESESDFQVQYDHVNTPPPPLSLYYPYIPPGIEVAVLKAMEKDPAARFRTVEEFGAALERPDAVYSAPGTGQVMTPGIPATGSRPVTGGGWQNVSTTPPPLAVGQAQGPTQAPSGAIAQPDVPLRHASASEFLRSKLFMLSAAFLVLLLIAGVVLWKNSNSHEAVNNKPAGSLSGGGGGSSPAQSPGQQTSGSQPPPTLTLPSVSTTPEVAQHKPTHQAVPPQPKPQRQPKPPSAPAQNQPTVAENQPRAVVPTPTAPSFGRSFRVRHRHVNKLGFFSKNKVGAPLEWYSNGTLTVSSSGGLTYHCVAAPSPNFCEPDIVLSAAAINNVKVNSDGLLHVGSSEGNYDFLGDGNTITEIRNELTARHRQ
jgi:serine/threonine protein kinase